MSVGLALVIGVVLPFAVVGLVYGLGKFGLRVQTDFRAKVIYLLVFAAINLMIGLAVIASEGISLRAGLWIFQGIAWAGFAIDLARRHKLANPKDR